MDFSQAAFDAWSFGKASGALSFVARVSSWSPWKGPNDQGRTSISRFLQKRTDLIGPLVPSWPGVAGLPRWSEYASELNMEVSGVSADVPSKLASYVKARRALSSSDCDGARLS